MVTRITIVLFALAAVSWTASIDSKIRQYRRIKEIPCNRLALEKLSSLGLIVDNARCFPRQIARGFSGYKRSGALELERRSCCGPECDWLIQDAGVDPATLRCPNDN
ncbi:uncharacterized protein LOC110239223 [Exaiptasia diaphana]|uniref:Uncharacterized protein n=1 Tax=Exaiptasia diaphana TaxID=2652724 RepID=A0A913X8M2_EXADI|nr:uncharacterized protein LOC110239223 [Exaiptasia diaphana]XP_020900596.1 uncharacterized protein LOC110239223 [Exaiptasia diaphana]KXJ14212.1 hypothetical protein AC249_AIPGENE20197 [Exaiptasia diaphana]